MLRTITLPLHRIPIPKSTTLEITRTFGSAAKKPTKAADAKGAKATKKGGNKNKDSSKGSNDDRSNSDKSATFIAMIDSTHTGAIMPEDLAFAADLETSGSIALAWNREARLFHNNINKELHKKIRGKMEAYKLLEGSGFEEHCKKIDATPVPLGRKVALLTPPIKGYNSTDWAA